MDITSFHGEHSFLSNFHPCKVVLDGITYPSVEHAYQAAKTVDRAGRLLLSKMTTAGHAKRFGQALRLRPDWDRVKQSVMFDLLWQKFQDPILRARLLDTAPFRLIEGNTWGDTYWGVCRGTGHNHLGRLLMQLRDQLQPVKGYLHD